MVKLDDSLSLDEKLKMIDQIMAETEAKNHDRIELGLTPIDPSDALTCEGCQ